MIKTDNAIPTQNTLLNIIDYKNETSLIYKNNKTNKNTLNNCTDYKKLSYLCKSLNNGILKKTELIENGQYPVVNSGREYYGYYSKYNNEGDTFCIASRGNAGFITYMKDKFWAGGLCYPYKSKDNKLILTKFIYYYLKNKEKYIMTTLVSKGSIPAINKSDVDKILIPVPPLSIQQHIICILDKFTKLEAELKAELKARKKQYVYYAKKIFNFKKTNSYKLVNICNNITTGRLNANAMTEDGQYPFFTCGSEIFKINTYAFNTTAILLAGNGNIGDVKFYSGKFNAYQRTYVISDFNDFVIDKYIYYYIKLHFKEYINKFIKKSVLSYITLPMLQNFQIYVPSLAEQQRVVDILDKFDALCNDLTSGLPAEIAARRKQYEYYRNKLLTFPEKKTIA